MRYYAKPVAVEAFVIKQVAGFLVAGGLYLETEDGVIRHADAGMIARYQPVAGDFFVIQQDGYEYLNPRAVFEHKYSATPPLFDVKIILGASIQVKITPKPEDVAGAELDDDFDDDDDPARNRERSRAAYCEPDRTRPDRRRRNWRHRSAGSGQSGGYSVPSPFAFPPFPLGPPLFPFFANRR